MSHFRTQLSQLIEAAISITSKLNEQRELSSNDQVALKSSVVSILPLSERYERLFRTTEVDDLKEYSAKLEGSAIDLWNAAALSMKIESVEFKKTLCSAKLFASLLCSIQDSIEPTIKGKFRLLNCLYRTLRSSLDEGENRLITKIQEHADRVFKDLEAVSSKFEESTLHSFNKIRSELFVTKMQLSIQENDIQMAKFYEERAGISSFSSLQDSETLTESARVIYSSSLSLYNQKRYNDVIYFLNRATGYLSSGWNTEFQESSRVQLSIHSLLVRACIDEKSEDSLRLAEDTLSMMQEQQSGTLEYYKLSIKLINARNGDQSDIEEVIMRMLMSSYNPSDFKLILGIINDFAQRDARGALKCFEFAFTNKIDPNRNHDELEMVIVAMINIYIKDTGSLIEYKKQSLSQLFDAAERKLVKPLSRKCSSSAVTLLWNAGKSESKNNNFEESLGWYKLALHRLLQVNDIDKAKIQRATQNSYINLERYDDAIKVYNSMNGQEKKSLISQYNMFKVYSCKEDEVKLMGCLKEMIDSNEQNLIPLLSLCAVNAKTNTRIAIESMVLLFKNIDTSLDLKVSIPSALRCVVELILKDGGFRVEYLDTLLTLLREAYKFANDSKNIKNYRFTVEELEWFSAQAFNVSRECLINDDFIYGDLFAELSIDLNLLMSEETSFEKSISFKLWRFRAGLISLMCISKKQGFDPIILWGSVRERSLKLRISIDEITIIIGNKPEFDKFKEEWEQCLMDCMIFQFQSELKLGNWSAIESILRETNNLKTIDFDSTLINIVSDQNQSYPDKIKSLVFTQILQRNFGDPSVSAIKISRWVRLLLKYNSGVDAEENCLKIVQQIYTRLCSQEEDNQFPAHEIEWIATTCWNNGISRLFNNQKIQGRLWCDKGMKLSRFVNERFQVTLDKLWNELQHLAE